VVSFTPRPLHPQGKTPWYPLDRRLGWGARAVLDAVVKRKILSPRRESNPRTQIVQPVAQRYTGIQLLIFRPHTVVNKIFPLMKLTNQF
jgi:hypothetical protein